MLDSRQLQALGTERAILGLLHAALAHAGVAVELAELTPAVSLRDDLGVDSFQLTNVARHIEEAYDLRFTLVDWVLEEEERDEATYTVGSLVSFIQHQLAQSV